MSSAPEYLDGPAGPPPSTPPHSRRTAWIAGAAVGVVAVAGAGSWAAWSFFSTGPQPAEALPASTVAYAGVDLDPSGGQKIEALRTLRKFPAFRDEFGLDADDDIRKAIFEEIQQAGCTDLDYGDDVEPWLGDRMAVAAVDIGEDDPTPVFVVQVTDEDAADTGLAKLRDCGGDGTEGAWTIADGWALVGESQDVVDGIAADAADAPLADDADFQHWTDEAGGDGIATAYVSPEAGPLLAEEFGDFTDPGTVDALEGFGGMAATLRFADGSFELEVAGDAGRAQDALGGSDRGDDALATLPDDTAAALGVGLVEGWFGNLVSEEALQELAGESDLDLPADAEALVGSSAALAVGGDFDPEVFFGMADGGVPIGLKVLGDAEAIGAVVDKIGEGLGTDSDGDVVAVGPDADYRQELLAGGHLADTDAFRHAVPDAEDAGAVLFVNFDTGSWLDNLSDGDEEFADNVEPLEALGASVRVDDGTSHVLIRVTTD